MNGRRAFKAGNVMAEKHKLEPAPLDDVLADPACCFATPYEVTKSQFYTAEEKLKILRQMEEDAENMAVATAEGMEGGEESNLSKIKQVIASFSESHGGD